jgi:hypothetical protein
MKIESSWESELAEIEELASEAEHEHLSIALDGNASSMAIVQSARTTTLLVRLLQGVRRPTDGDRFILKAKATTLRELLNRDV